MINKVVLVGRVGVDATLRSTAAGAQVVNFTLATSDSIKDKKTGEYKEYTEWHNITCWKSTDYAKGIKKGDMVYIEGQLKTNKWQDDKGVDRYKTEVVIGGFNSNIRVLSRKAKEGNAAAPAETYEQPIDEMPNDDIPF